MESSQANIAAIDGYRGEHLLLSIDQNPRAVIQGVKGNVLAVETLDGALPVRCSFSEGLSLGKNCLLGRCRAVRSNAAIVD